MMGGIGSHSGNTVLGASAGGILGGVLCYGVATGIMSTVTVGAVFFALFFCMIGPGFDDYGGNAEVPAALFGGFIGWLFRRRRA
jgi:hypothetical protein